MTSKRAQFNTCPIFTLCTTSSLRTASYLITGSIPLLLSHKEIAYINYDMLLKLHILEKSCNNVSKGAIYFHTADCNDINRYLFNKLIDDSYLPG